LSFVLSLIGEIQKKLFNIEFYASFRLHVDLVQICGKTRINMELRNCISSDFLCTFCLNTKSTKKVKAEKKMGHVVLSHAMNPRPEYSEFHLIVWLRLEDS